MKYELVVENPVLGVRYDISNIVEEIRNETHISDYPGKLEFSFHDNTDVQIKNGNTVYLSIDETKIFSGFVFSTQVDEDNFVKVTAYDCLRYFKNTDFLIIQEGETDEGIPLNTIYEVVATCCMRNNLKALKIVEALGPNEGPTRLSPYIFNGNTYFEIIEHCIDEMLVRKGIWYFVRAVRNEFDRVEIRNIRNLNDDEPVIIITDDEQLIRKYTYSRSIDEDTFNQIRYTKEVEEGEGSEKITKRYHYMVSNQASINEWGTLQYFENLNDSSLTEDQIQERAAMMLKLKNRETQSFRITIDGSKYVFAGAPVYVNIVNLTPYGFINGKLYIVESCTHIIKGTDYSTDLNLLVVE